MADRGRRGTAPPYRPRTVYFKVYLVFLTVVYLTSLDQKSLTWKLLRSHIYVSCTSKLTVDINHIFFRETIIATPAFGLWFWDQSDAWCQKVFGMAIAFWHSLPRYYKSTSSMNIFPISAVHLEQRVTLWARNPQRLTRPCLLEAAPMGDISTPWLITPARQASTLNFLHNNKHDLSCHWEWSSE